MQLSGRLNMMNAGRWIKRYRKLGNFSIEPWDSRYYALFEKEEMVCVTAYKKGAIEVMKRLSKANRCQDCKFKNQRRRSKNGHLNEKAKDDKEAHDNPWSNSRGIFEHPSKRG